MRVFQALGWLAVLLPLAFASTTYYVSNAIGSDSNAGTAETAPWKTVSKVQSAQGTLKSGDQVLFCNGDSWFQDGMSLTTAGISYGVYDCGLGQAHPVITRSAYIPSSAWKSLSSGYLQTSLASYPNAVANGVSGVWIDDFRLIKARIPNLLDPTNRVGQLGEWYWMDNRGDSGQAVLTSAALKQPDGYWAGSTLHYRAYDWLWFTTPITTSTGTTVTCGWDIGRPIGGLFFEAGTSTQGAAWLDAPGEFFYDSTTQLLTIVPLNSQMSADILSGAHHVYANFFANNPTVSINAANIALSNLSIIMSSGTGINLGNKGFVTLNRMFIGQTVNGQGIYGSGNNVVIQNTVVTDTDDSCITGYFGGSSQIVYSTLTKCGIYQGYPTQSQNGFSGNVLSFAWNYVANVGYAGINPNGGTAIVHNQLFNSCLVLNDCGAIYSYYQTGISIFNNTIDGIVCNGAAYGTNPLGAGIYLDQGTSGIVSNFNTIKNVIQCAYLHMSNNHVFSYNRCESPGIFLVGGGTNGGGHTVTNNVVYTHGTNGVLQNPLVRFLNQWTATLSDVVTDLSGQVFCDYRVGDNNYVFQIQTSQGTWRSNDFTGYATQGRSILPSFETNSQWRVHLEC